MITITALKRPPTASGVVYFRQLQPLMHLNKYCKDVCNVQFVAEEELPLALPNTDIYFSPTPAFDRSRRIHETMQDMFPKVKIVYDFDDSPWRHIPMTHPSYVFTGLIDGKQNLGCGYKFVWENKETTMEVGGTVHTFDITRNSRSIDTQKWLASNADRLTTTTDVLSKALVSEYDLKTKPEVLPNFLIPELYTPVKDITKDEDEIRIGWIWGFSHLKDFLDLLPYLKDVVNKYPNVKVYLMTEFELKPELLTDQFIVIPAKSIFNGYFDIVRNMDLDIGLMHLAENNTYNRCKSPLKYLEMSALGAVSVAPVTLYGDYIDPNKSGLLYQNKDDFKDKLSKAIEDKQARLDMLKEAKKLLPTYSAGSVVLKYLDLFENIVGDNACAN